MSSTITSPTRTGSSQRIAWPSNTKGTEHPAQLLRIGKRFRLVRRLGGGAFGEVYIGVDAVTEEQVAIKLEPINTAHQPHLQHEARLYQILARGVVNVGVPRLRYFGREGSFNTMVMDLLGPSLEDLFDHCGRRFRLKTVCMLGVQMLQRLEFLHEMGYLHRDLKPENFVMGVGKRSHHLYLIDMGLAKRYRDPKTHEHIPFIDGKSLTGTARYVSISTHLGHQQSRRDDLESVAIILIYFAAGGLPWQGVRCISKLQKYELIKKMKIDTSPTDLCKDIQCPQPFIQLLQYSRDLEFSQEPDYGSCIRILTDLMAEMDWDHDFQFHWLESNPKCSDHSSSIHSPPMLEVSENTAGNTSLVAGQLTTTGTGSSFVGTNTLAINSRHFMKRSGPQQRVRTSIAGDEILSPRVSTHDTANVIESEFI